MIISSHRPAKHAVMTRIELRAEQSTLYSGGQYMYMKWRRTRQIAPANLDVLTQLNDRVDEVYNLRKPGNRSHRGYQLRSWQKDIDHGAHRKEIGLSRRQNGMFFLKRDLL
jgi:hypothetical protein